MTFKVFRFVERSLPQKSLTLRARKGRRAKKTSRNESVLVCLVFFLHLTQRRQHERRLFFFFSQYLTIFPKTHKHRNIQSRTNTHTHTRTVFLFFCRQKKVAVDNIGFLIVVSFVWPCIYVLIAVFITPLQPPDSFMPVAVAACQLFSDPAPGGCRWDFRC